MDDESVEGEALVCPYCGEDVEPTVEGELRGDSYVEDCPVCCRPWTVLVSRTVEGVSVRLLRADD